MRSANVLCQLVGDARIGFRTDQDRHQFPRRSERGRSTPTRRSDIPVDDENLVAGDTETVAGLHVPAHVSASRWRYGRIRTWRLPRPGPSCTRRRQPHCRDRALRARRVPEPSTPEGSGTTSIPSRFRPYTWRRVPRPRHSRWAAPAPGPHPHRSGLQQLTRAQTTGRAEQFRIGRDDVRALLAEQLGGAVTVDHRQDGPLMLPAARRSPGGRSALAGPVLSTEIWTLLTSPCIRPASMAPPASSV